MQPRCYHEQDHLRNASQPQPSRSLDRTTPSPITSSSSRTRCLTNSASSHDYGYHHPKRSKDSSGQKMKPTGSLEGGWLASGPIQPHSISAPSLSMPHCSSTSAENGNAKEMLGAISNEDILKLTQLTDKLPMVSRKHNHVQKCHGHTKDRSYMDKEDQCINQRKHHHLTRHVPKDSQPCDTGLADLLSQDFMRTSSSTSNSDVSGLLAIPSSCNPSTISTDTDDSQLSWHNTNHIYNSYKGNKQSTPDVLTEMNSHQTIKSTPAAEPFRPHHYHPLTITTTNTAPYLDTHLTPSSSQDSGHSSRRRSWYRALMKRDKKSKTKYDDSPMTTHHSDSTPDTTNTTDDPSTDMYPLLLQVPTIIDTDTHNSTSLRSHTNPMIDTENHLLSRQRKQKIKNQLGLGRLRLPSRHKRRSSTDLENNLTTTATTTTFHKTKRESGRLGQLGSHHRRHSFDNLREYDLTTTDCHLDIHSSSSSSSVSSTVQSPSQLPIATHHHNNNNTTLFQPPAGVEPDNLSFTGSGIEGTPEDTINNNQSGFGNKLPDTTEEEHRNLKKVFYFDYQSLPWDNKLGEPKGVKGLVKRMVDSGFGTISEKRIKPVEDDEEEDQDSINSMGDDEEKKQEDGTNKDEEDDGDDGVSTIEASKVITGDIFWMNQHYPVGSMNGTRQIAEIHVDAENDLEFVKLTQLANDVSLVKGHLLNLRVSFLASDKTDDDRTSYIHQNNTLCKNVNDRLVSLDPFIENAQAFLKERGQQCRAFIPMEDSASDIQQLLLRQDSDSTKHSDSDIETRFDPSPKSPAPTRRPQSCASYRTGTSSLWCYVPYQEYNAYEYRQDQLIDAVSDLQRGIDELRRSLKDTETLVHGVQIDMNDTKTKMDTYLKDVPETHYSELKRLEVSIESILANRAKSRGMELLYWLLTALLTGCAFLLWAAICALKLGQAALSFPRKMVKAFIEHMEERNRVVKQAARRSVARGADRPPSIALDPSTTTTNTNTNTNTNTPSNRHQTPRQTSITH